MKHVINNTKNNMFKDKHLMWKIIALVFCIKRKHSKSKMAHIYEYTDIYIYIYIYTNSYAYRCAHMCIYIITLIYTISWYSLCYTHYVRRFSFGSSKFNERFQVQRPFLF